MANKSHDAEVLTRQFIDAWEILKDYGFQVQTCYFTQIEELQPELTYLQSPTRYFSEVLREELLLEGVSWSAETRQQIERGLRSRYIDVLSKNTQPSEDSWIILDPGLQRWARLKYGSTGSSEALLWEQFQADLNSKIDIDANLISQIGSHTLTSLENPIEIKNVLEIARELMAPYISEWIGKGRTLSIAAPLAVGGYYLHCKFDDLSLIHRGILSIDFGIRSNVRGENLSAKTPEHIWPAYFWYRRFGRSAPRLKLACIALCAFILSLQGTTLTEEAKRKGQVLQ